MSDLPACMRQMSIDPTFIGKTYIGRMAIDNGKTRRHSRQRCEIDHDELAMTAKPARRFKHFAAIDWSGAAGERHRGIALAVCRAGDGAPRLVRPGHRWSRADVLAWLLDEMTGDTLVGLDLGISLPFADCGAFF